MMFWKFLLPTKSEPARLTKATAYAKHCEVKPPEFFAGQRKVASVNHLGHLVLYDLGTYPTLTPMEAQTFADWLYETFEAEHGRP